MSKILIVEDQKFTKNAICDILYSIQKDIHLDFVESPANAQSLIRESSSTLNPYQIIITDLQFANGYKSFDVILEARKNDIPCIVFSMFEIKSIVLKSKESGACAYISKLDEYDELENCVRSIQPNSFYCSKRIQEILLIKDFGWTPHPLELTTTERHILHCLANGLTMKQIESNFNLNSNTLRVHRRQMMQKNKCNYEQLLACYNMFPPKDNFNFDFLKK